jgi:hypothetical protein
MAKKRYPLWRYENNKQSILVMLSPKLIRYAAHRGVERQIDNLMRSRQEAYGHDPSRDWQTHINGCLGELAVAVCLNLPWDGQVGDLDAMDVGPYQVRTAYPSIKGGPDPRLILHPTDSMEDIFIHVIGANSHFRLMGWIWAMEGQQSAYWQDPSRAGRPAYFVPNDMLRPMFKLMERGNDPLTL